MKAYDIFAEFQDIYGFLAKNYFSSTYGKVHLISLLILGALIFVSGMVLFWWWFTAKPKNCWLLRLEKLELIFLQQQKDAITLQEFYKYLTEMTGLIVDHFFKTGLSSATEVELLFILQKQTTNLALVAKLEDFLIRAQSVKFANQKQSPDQLLQDFTMIKNSLQQCLLEINNKVNSSPSDLNLN